MRLAVILICFATTVAHAQPASMQLGHARPGTWVYDVVQAKRGADRWNANHALSVTPGLVGNTSAPGLFVSGRF